MSTLFYATTDIRYPYRIVVGRDDAIAVTSTICLSGQYQKTPVGFLFLVF